MSDEDNQAGGKKRGLFGRLFGGRESAPAEPAPAALAPVEAAQPEAPAEPRSWWRRLKEGLARSSTTISRGIVEVFTKRKLDGAMLDELEEWRMLLEHYCVVLAVREPSVPDGAPAPLSNLELRTPAIRPPLCTLQPPGEPNLIIPSLVASSFTSENCVACRTDEVYSVEGTRGGSNATAGRVVIAGAVETNAVPLGRHPAGSSLSSVHGAPPVPLDRMIEDAQEECGWD